LAPTTAPNLTQYFDGKKLNSAESPAHFACAPPIFSAGLLAHIIY